MATMYYKNQRKHVALDYEILYAYSFIIICESLEEASRLPKQKLKICFCGLNVTL